MRLAGFRVAHHFRVAVVGGDDERAAGLFDGLGQSAEASIDGLDRFGRGLDTAGVPDHVRIRVIHHDHVEPSRADRFDDFVGNFGRRHLGLPIVCRDLRRRDENPLLTRKDRLAPAIEKKRDMGVFFGFRDAQLGQPGP